MPFPLTEEQRKIVDDRGGELLVSAAAGSGKTRVLVERLLDRVAAEGLDIDRFLVITTITVALYILLSFNVTSRRSAPSITWLFVTI